MKRVLAASLATGALVVGSTGALAAVAYPVQGGYWEYGNQAAYAYSYYFHGDRCHGSSLKREGSWVSRSPNTAAGSTSKATSWHAPWTGGYEYYYRVC